MSKPLDLSQFPDLPPEVLKALEAQQAALEKAQFEVTVERAARLHHQAEAEEKGTLVVTLTALVEKLETQVADYKRTKFGPKSEKLTPDQLELALEDQETAIAETQAEIENVQAALEKKSQNKSKAPRKPRKPRALPEGLPRIERVIEPDSIVCPCGCGDMVTDLAQDRPITFSPPYSSKSLEMAGVLLNSTLYIFSQVQVQKTASFAMNSRASSSGRMTPPMSPMSSHLRLCDQ